MCDTISSGSNNRIKEYFDSLLLTVVAESLRVLKSTSAQLQGYCRNCRSGLVAALTLTLLVGFDGMARVNWDDKVIAFDRMPGVVVGEKAVEVGISSPDVTDGHWSIYYTTGGELPTVEHGTEYDGGVITITPPERYHTVTLNVLAVSDDGQQYYDSATYIFYDPEGDGGSASAQRRLRVSTSSNTSQAGESAGRYEKIDDLSELTDGDRVIFVAYDHNLSQPEYLTMCTIYSMNINGGFLNPPPANSRTIETTSLPSKVSEFYIHRGSADDTWTLQIISTGQYFGINDPTKKSYNIFSNADAPTADSDISLVRQNDDTFMMTFGGIPLYAAVDPSYHIWQLTTASNHNPDYHKFSPCIYRYTTAAEVIDVPLEVSDELYVTLSHNRAINQNPPTATRIKYDAETQTYKASLSGLEGNIIIRDGCATLDGIYLGVQTDASPTAANTTVTDNSNISNETTDNQAEWINPTTGPTMSQPAAIDPGQTLTLAYRPSTLVPITTNGEVPLRWLEAELTLNRRAGTTTPAHLTIANMSITGIQSVVIDQPEQPFPSNSSFSKSTHSSAIIPEYYTVTGQRLPSRPNRPGLYLMCQGTTVTKLLLRH